MRLFALAAVSAVTPLALAATSVAAAADEYLYYASAPKGGCPHPAIWRADQNGTRAVRVLPPSAQGGTFDVSRDGRYIVRSETDTSGDRSHLFLYDMVEGTSRQLTKGRFSTLSPRFSPNGRTVAFIRTPHNYAEVGQIYKVPSSGGRTTRLVGSATYSEREPSSISTFSWSPNGKQIAYIDSQKYLERVNVSVGPRSRHLVMPKTRSGAHRPYSGSASAVAWTKKGMVAHVHFFFYPPAGGTSKGRAPRGMYLIKRPTNAWGRLVQRTKGTRMMAGLTMSADAKRTVGWTSRGIYRLTASGFTSMRIARPGEAHFADAPPEDLLVERAAGTSDPAIAACR